MLLSEFAPRLVVSFWKCGIDHLNENTNFVDVMSSLTRVGSTNLVELFVRAYKACNII